MGKVVVKYDTLTLNGVCRNGKELEKYCVQAISDKTTPDWLNHIYQFILQWLSPEDYIIAQTSGSTGEPKQIKLQKRHMIASAEKTINYFNLYENQTALLCLSANYIAGKMMIVRAFVGQFNLRLTEPDGYPLMYNTERIDFVAMVPLQVSNSLSDPDSWRLVNTVIIGGGAVSENLKQELAKVDTSFYETYGMTETVSHVAVRKIGEEDCFHAMPKVRFSVDDRSCLVIQASYILAEPIVTNDIVDIQCSGTFLLRGRYDDVINTGAVKISPEELERKLAKAIDLPFFISSIKDEKLGNKVVLVIEAETDVDYIEKLLLEFPDLNKFEKPKHIVQVNKFPLTDTLKVKRNELREMISNII